MFWQPWKNVLFGQLICDKLFWLRLITSGLSYLCHSVFFHKYYQLCEKTMYIITASNYSNKYMYCYLIHLHYFLASHLVFFASFLAETHTFQIYYSNNIILFLDLLALSPVIYFTHQKNKVSHGPWLVLSLLSCTCSTVVYKYHTEYLTTL